MSMSALTLFPACRLRLSQWRGVPAVQESQATQNLPLQSVPAKSISNPLQMGLSAREGIGFQTRRVYYCAVPSIIMVAVQVIFVLTRYISATNASAIPMARATALVRLRPQTSSSRRRAKARGRERKLDVEIQMRHQSVAAPLPRVMMSPPQSQWLPFRLCRLSPPQSRLDTVSRRGTTPIPLH